MRFVRQASRTKALTCSAATVSSRSLPCGDDVWSSLSLKLCGCRVSARGRSEQSRARSCRRPIRISSSFATRRHSRIFAHAMAGADFGAARSPGRRQLWRSEFERAKGQLRAPDLSFAGLLVRQGVRGEAAHWQVSHAGPDQLGHVRCRLPRGLRQEEPMPGWNGQALAPAIVGSLRRVEACILAERPAVKRTPYAQGSWRGPMPGWIRVWLREFWRRLAFSHLAGSQERAACRGWH
jgi:hypothetical protein